MVQIHTLFRLEVVTTAAATPVKLLLLLFSILPALNVFTAVTALATELRIDTTLPLNTTVTLIEICT
jgi:hypothetical protein